MTLTLLALALLGHWGEVGHRLIGAAATSALPAEMPAFFRSSADELSYLNPEPDRWRSRAERALDPAMDAATAPEHYIDLERVPAGALDACDRFAYLDSLRAHGVDAAGAGLLPYRILELSQPGELRVDESPRVFPSLRPAILEYLHESNALVPKLYELDKLRDVWWTAWITSGQTQETVESVIAHDIAARGGADRMHALRTVRQLGLLINGRDTSHLVIEDKLPDAMRMEITAAGKTLVRAYDGRTGWQIVPGEKTANLMTPAEQKNISHEADLLTGLVDYISKGNKVALLGTESVEGRDAYKVQVTLRDSTAFTYFIDRETWLPVKWQGGPWETMFKSFIDIGGVKVPSRFETTERGSTVAPPTILVITSAVANPSLPDARFAPPAGAR